MEKDNEQKAAIAQRLWQLGFFPEINAKFYTPTGVERTPKQITDIDVLGFRMDDFFRPERIAVDCKTSKMSPINRAIWLHGIMQEKHIRTGFVIAKKSVPIDHRQAALGWGVSIVEESEIDAFFNLVAGVQECGLLCLQPESWVRLYGDMPSKEALGKLLDYILFFYWADPPIRSLRYTLIGCREGARVLKSDQRLHVALVADCIARFAMSLLQVVSEILPVHLVVNDKELLSKLIKVHIYGGRESYQHMNLLHRMVQKLSKAHREESLLDDDAEADLTLPEWDMFLSIVRSGLEYPRTLALVPRVLRFFAIDRILYGAKTWTAEAVPAATSRTLHMASDVIGYFCRATILEDGILATIQAECDRDILAAKTA